MQVTGYYLVYPRLVLDPQHCKQKGEKKPSSLETHKKPEAVTILHQNTEKKLALHTLFKNVARLV